MIYDENMCSECGGVYVQYRNACNKMIKYVGKSRADKRKLEQRASD